ncbi:DUF624 domain-containing protein [Rathayibacter sp. VKM Ac-2804]|uniref:YesL family protein n=1 Tax=unclassified Rathayibacter TaxID=2609250 RepID=UPI00132F40E9|nr:MULTISPECIES: DUF624 domain-containing protein [unclassified Rathayibacter]NRG39305.1 DUF624 domain-containing protein [Rathayibacter sp. VKM Ac-2835]QHF24423.1 DUF624 domain-containing protein [Rathayibacter sp. VKM Ac-2804]
MASLAERYEAACRMVLLVLVVSAAMLVFTLRGAVVAGFFPSVAAAHAVYRARLLDADGPWSLRRTVSTFARSWSDEFPRANLPGAVLLGVGALLWADHRILGGLEVDAVGVAATGVLLVVTVLFALFAVEFWIVRAHFAERTRWQLRTTALLLLARPLCTLMLAAVLLLLLALATSAPVLGLLAAAAVLPFAATAVVQAFGRLPGFRPSSPARPPTA